MLVVLGFLDFLLIFLVVDNISCSYYDFDCELVGQGIGNFVLGLCGGLLGVGVIMWMVININFGGKISIVGMIYVLILLMIVFKVGQLIEFIFYVVLVGIFIKVGIDIVDWSFFKWVY